MTERLEIERIYQEFERLLSDNGRLEQYCKNARKFAEQYLDLKKIATQYAAFIMDHHKPSLTEEMLGRISKEIGTKSYTSYQIEQLGRTLTYSKNPEPSFKEEIQ